MHQTALQFLVLLFGKTLCNKTIRNSLLFTMEQEKEIGTLG